MVDISLFYEIQVANPLRQRENEQAVFDQVLDQVELADGLGYSTFWTVEHHFQPGFSHCSAPEVLYGAVSQRTKNIRIGHSVVLLPFPYNHPVRIAERVATIDILSHGRMEVGTGRSSTVQELGGFGIPPEETRSRWEDALRCMITIWTSENGTFSYKGQYYDIPERTIVPLPVQKPYPRIWMATATDSSHEIAGRLGLGLLTLVVATPPDQVAQRIEMYDTAAKNPEPIGPVINNRKAVFYMGHCAETDEKARAQAERSFVSYVSVAGRNAARLRAQIAAQGGGGADAPTRPGVNPNDADTSDFTMEYMLDNRTAICGSPDTCIRQIEDILKYVKVDEIMLMQQFWAMSHEETMKSIELFGKHVIPHFAKQGVKVGS